VVLYLGLHQQAQAQQIQWLQIHGSLIFSAKANLRLAQEPLKLQIQLNNLDNYH